MNVPPVEQLLVADTATLREAIRVITDNAQGVAFVVDTRGTLVGIATDGDLRRALLRGCGLDDGVALAMNPDFVSRRVTAPREEVLGLLSNRVRHIPLLDDEGRPIDYACASRLHRIPVLEPHLGGNELVYLSECIRTQWISSKGAFITRFENQFRDLTGMPFALATSNGTTALHLALAALGIGPGHEVIVPDLTFAACANAVLYTGATPVLVDVDPATWTMAPEAVRRAVGARTRAIMPVHLYGHPCDMDPLLDIAREHDLLVVEDCAEALGSRYRGRHVGTFGDAATYSFYGNKTVTTGEGGMVLFRDGPAHRRAATLRDHGMSPAKRYWHLEVGFNYRMTNLQAAVGVAQMERLETLVSAKIAMAARYDALLADLPDVERPPRQAWGDHSYWLYVLRLRPPFDTLRDTLVEKLLLNGVDTRAAFYPLHAMPPYQSYGEACTLPNSIEIAASGLGLPSSVTLDEAEQRHVVQSLSRLLRTARLAVDIATR